MIDDASSKTAREGKEELLHTLEEKIRDLRGALTATARQKAEKILTDLANARNLEALRKFQTSWPEVSQEAVRVLPVNFLGEDAEVPQALRHVSFLAYLVRRLWVGDEEGVKKLQQILLAHDRSLELVRSPFRLDWRRGSFIYQPETELQRALYHLAQYSDRAKLCANVDCDNPYFLGIRGNERYCSDACFAVGRKQAKRAWWGEHGEEWRSARETLKRKDKQKKGKR